MRKQTIKEKRAEDQMDYTFLRNEVVSHHVPQLYSADVQ